MAIQCHDSGQNKIRKSITKDKKRKKLPLNFFVPASECKLKTMEQGNVGRAC